MTAAVANVSSHTKSGWLASLAQKKAEKAVERARLAAEEAEQAREKAREELLSRGLRKQEEAPNRTSAKAFLTYKPTLALAALDHRHAA